MFFKMPFEVYMYTCMFTVCKQIMQFIINNWGHRGRDRMVVGFTTTCAISTYHHKRCEFEPRSWRGVLDTTFCDKVCQ